MLRIFIWGTGRIAESVLKNCNVFDTYEILGFIDNKVDEKNNKFHGKDVYGPEILSKIIPEKIVVLTDAFDEIRRQIEVTFPALLHIVENKNYFYKQILISEYKNTTATEIFEILNYLQNNHLDVFNYDFKRKYDSMDIVPVFDDECGMYYVLHGEKRLYFARYMDTPQKITEYYRGLLIEQDEESPHRYLSDDFEVEEGGVVVDAGVAEGNFSLEIIDRVSKIYLIEADVRWIEALQQTFKDYKDKVVICQKYVGCVNEGDYATLDALIAEPIHFLEMDIEGSEREALLGAEKIIEKSETLKCAICSYHRDDDEMHIKKLLTKYRMECSTTKGYMWFPYGDNEERVSTRLCRGIVRGEK